MQNRVKKITRLKKLAPAVQAEIEGQRAMHSALLSRLGESHRNLSRGYFGPGSMTWKLYREPSIILGSMRALLLQIAHPAIAQGVADYSNFKKDLAGRSHRTFLSMVRIWFGDIPTANQSARRLHNIHSMIRGQLVWETEDETIINPFCAAEPDLLFWVLATLVDTTIHLYEKTVHKLSRAEKEQFYEESKITAQLMGIPIDQYPKNLTAFYNRYLTIIESGTLRLSAAGKAITQTLFSTPYPIRRFSEIMAEALLPVATKRLFELKPGRRVYELICFLAKTYNKLIPNDLRYAPHYHQAMFRIALSDHKKPRLIERMHYWLASHLNWYFISNKLTIKKI